MSLRRSAGELVQRAIVRAAGRFGLETYRPMRDYLEHLDALTEYAEDGRAVRDSRATTIVEGRDLTITTEGLEDVLGTGFRGARVLEVGPKYGIHSRWLDANLEPTELVFCDFASDRALHDEWRHELRSPQAWVYGDLREAAELRAMEPFDLVLFLGVLYHSVYHLQLLAALNAVTRLGGAMLLETTYDPKADASVRLRWQPRTQKAKAVPTIDALRVLLAWTGFRTVTRFTDYRPGSAEAIFLCEKTDELVAGSEFAPVVTPHRPAGT